MLAPVQKSRVANLNAIATIIPAAGMKASAPMIHAAFKSFGLSVNATTPSPFVRPWLLRRSFASPSRNFRCNRNVPLRTTGLVERIYRCLRAASLS